MLIRGDGIAVFRWVNVRFFLRPALIDAFEAPFEAAFLADGLVVDDDEDRIGVRAGADAQGEPAAFFDGHVEAQIVRGAVGGDVLSLHGDAVDEEFDGNLP